MIPFELCISSGVLNILLAVLVWKIYRRAKHLEWVIVNMADWRKDFAP